VNPNSIFSGENQLQEFSINLRNGIQLVDAPLSRILEKNAANRTEEENASLSSAIKNFTLQLNEKTKSKFNSTKIQEIYNVSFRHKRDNLIDVSYTIRTKPVSELEGTSIRAKLLESALKDPSLYDDIEFESADVKVSKPELDKDSVSGIWFLRIFFDIYLLLIFFNF
jgi:hypothetical protein